jgi:hypothetical protein
MNKNRALREGRFTSFCDGMSYCKGWAGKTVQSLFARFEQL